MYKKIVNDWLKFGTMLSVSRWLQPNSFSYLWLMNALYILIGYTVAHFVLSALSLDTQTLEDLVKVGTMLLITGGITTPEDWLYTSMSTLVGFTVYHEVVKPLLPVTDIVFTDLAKYGTVLTTRRLLSGKSLDMGWIFETLSILLGFTVYNVATLVTK